MCCLGLLMHPSSQQPSSLNSLGQAANANLMRSARGGGAVGPQNFEQNSMMMKSHYEQQQQQQQQMLAAQQSLQGLLSPGSNSSCSSTTQQPCNSDSNNYPLAMDCDRSTVGHTTDETTTAAPTNACHKCTLWGK